MLFLVYKKEIYWNGLSFPGAMPSVSALGCCVSKVFDKWPGWCLVRAKSIRIPKHYANIHIDNLSLTKIA